MTDDGNSDNFGFAGIGKRISERREARAENVDNRTQAEGQPDETAIEHEGISSKHLGLTPSESSQPTSESTPYTRNTSPDAKSSHWLWAEMLIVLLIALLTTLLIATIFGRHRQQAPHTSTKADQQPLPPPPSPTPPPQNQKKAAELRERIENAMQKGLYREALELLPEFEKNCSSNFDMKSIPYWRTEANKKLGLVNDILEKTIHFEGTVVDKTPMEGSGGFWSFVLYIQGGSKREFLCSSYNDLYFRINSKDIDFLDGYEKLQRVYSKAKVYILKPDGKIRGDRHCPISIDMLDEKSNLVDTSFGRTQTSPVAIAPKARLFVEPNLTDATVRILNIKPRYTPGIELESGKYHIEVSRDGYETVRRWIEVRGPESHREPITLSKSTKPQTDASSKWHFLGKIEAYSVYLDMQNIERKDNHRYRAWVRMLLSKPTDVVAGDILTDFDCVEKTFTPLAACSVYTTGETQCDPQNSPTKQIAGEILLPAFPLICR